MDTVFVRIGKKLSTSETYDRRGLAGDFGFFLKRVETKETIKETTRIREKRSRSHISPPFQGGRSKKRFAHPQEPGTACPGWPKRAVRDLNGSAHRKGLKGPGNGFKAFNRTPLGEIQ